MSVASKPKRPREDTSMAVEGVNDIAANLSIPPFQPILGSYPTTMFGGKFRNFNKNWFEDRYWLEYSQITNRAFCYCCRAFKSSSSSEEWVKTGYKNWKAAMEKDRGLKGHENSGPHTTPW